jgi:hypothetical protein
MKIFIMPLVSVLLLSSHTVFALVCKQSEVIPLATVHEQTGLLGTQFSRIDHIEVMPQKVTPSKTGFTVDSVQILICGELLPQTPAAANTPGQTCNFDSGCAAPMRCQNNLCVLPQ